MAKSFEPSKLGTKSHWDEVYENELTSYKDNGDVGEVWFGYDSVERVLDWLEDQECVNQDSSILDLGCGNGITLTQLYERGYRNLTGVDYSHSAIDLAKAIAKDKDMEIKYETVDILGKDCAAEILKESYNIIVDKGTYDAICLNPDLDTEICRTKYTKSVQALLAKGGLFILTSCNWTEEELKSHFCQDTGFRYRDRIKTPTFQFGGQTGSREACVIFTNT